MNRQERRRAGKAERARLLGGRGSMADTMRLGYAAGVPILLTDAARRHLGHDLGGSEAVIPWLLDLVKDGDHPLGINVVEADGSSQTIFLGPRGWTTERLAGHVATMRPMLEREFGKVDRFSFRTTGS